MVSFSEYFHFTNIFLQQASQAKISGTKGNFYIYLFYICIKVDQNTPQTFFHPYQICCLFLMSGYIGLLNPTIHRELEWPLKLNSLCVLCGFSVGSLYVTNFLILLQHNIRPQSRNCNVCATKFVVGVNLRRHDTSTPTVMNFMKIFR